MNRLLLLITEDPPVAVALIAAAVIVFFVGRASAELAKAKPTAAPVLPLAAAESALPLIGDPANEIERGYVVLRLRPRHGGRVSYLVTRAVKPAFGVDWNSTDRDLRYAPALTEVHGTDVVEILGLESHGGTDTFELRTAVAVASLLAEGHAPRITILLPHDEVVEECVGGPKLVRQRAAA